MEIRAEQPEDAGGVWRVNELAFGRPDEADLVARLTARGAVTLSLVAVEAGEIVGHVFFTPMTVEDGGQTTPAVGLGPVAVLPDRQGGGIGTQLITAGLEACRVQGAKAAFVLGHPDYYPRFGFVPSTRYAIRSTYDVPEDVFMAMELQPGGLAGVQGVARYQPEFDGV